jgi:hypothetical protein
MPKMSFHPEALQPPAMEDDTESKQNTELARVCLTDGSEKYSDSFCNKVCLFH